MKYKIEKGSQLFDDMQAVYKKVNDSNDECEKFAKNLGATAWVKGRYIGGGLRGLQFKEKPEGWGYIGNRSERYKNLFSPNCSGKDGKITKDVREQISQLPRVEAEELKTLVKYETQSFGSNDGIAFSTLPQISFGKNIILINVENNARFKPSKEMIEILESEYVKLHAKIEKENKEPEDAFPVYSGG